MGVGVSSRRERAEQRSSEAARLLLADGHSVRVGALRPRLEACEQSPLRSLVLGTLAWDDGDAATAGAVAPGCSGAASGPGDDDQRILTRALVQLGGLYATQGRPQDGIDVATRALALDPADAQVERLGWITLALGWGGCEALRPAWTAWPSGSPSRPRRSLLGDADLLVTRGSLGFYAGRTTAAIADCGRRSTWGARAP